MQISRRTLASLTATGRAAALLGVTGCSRRRRPGPDDLILTQGRVTQIVTARVGYANRFEDRNALSIFDEEQAPFESAVDVRDGDVLSISGAFWTFFDIGTSGGRAQLAASPTTVTDLRPGDPSHGLLFDSGHVSLGTTSRLELTALSGDGATVKRWKGFYTGKDTDETELVELTAGTTITVGRITLVAQRFQPTAERVRGFVTLDVS